MLNYWPWDRFREKTDFDEVVKVLGKRALIQQQRSTAFSRLLQRICHTGKGKWSIAVCNQPHRYGNSYAIWDHTVLAATRQRWHSRLYPSQLKLVLNLATDTHQHPFYSALHPLVDKLNTSFKRQECHLSWVAATITLHDPIWCCQQVNYGRWVQMSFKIDNDGYGAVMCNNLWEDPAPILYMVSGVHPPESPPTQMETAIGSAVFAGLTVVTNTQTNRLINHANNRSY